MMKTALKILAGIVVTYVAIVAGFETWLGISQPTNRASLVITTYDADGNANERVLTRLNNDGRVYVSANHWPRAWYRQALANPNVLVALDAPPAPYIAVPVDDATHKKLMREHAHSLKFRFLTGFPPRYFVRLDPA